MKQKDKRQSYCVRCTTSFELCGGGVLFFDDGSHHSVFLLWSNLKQSQLYNNITQQRIAMLRLMFLLGVLAAGAAEEEEAVTCGSSIKLVHLTSGHNLHSHSIAYGSGSGQNSVTAHGVKDDHQSLWTVKEGHADDVCEIGTPVRCGNTIRLQHVATGKNLHSHHFKSPISNNQEVSGFGDNGEGDRGDNWEVLCTGKKEFWQRGHKIQLRHSETGQFLHSNSKVKFDQRNCGHQCPIMDQLEVCAVSPSKSQNTYWKTGQGVYFPSQTSSVSEQTVDDEL